MANQRGEELTDEQWAVLSPWLPALPRRTEGRGRPWRDTREVRNGVLWIPRRARAGLAEPLSLVIPASI